MFLIIIIFLFYFVTLFITYIIVQLELVILSVGFFDSSSLSTLTCHTTRLTSSLVILNFYSMNSSYFPAGFLLKYGCHYCHLLLFETHVNWKFTDLLKTAEGAECSWKWAALLAVWHVAPRRAAPFSHPRQLHAPAALEGGGARAAHRSGETSSALLLLRSILTISTKYSSYTSILTSDFLHIEQVHKF